MMFKRKEESNQDNIKNKDIYDLVIIGGGLTGLTLIKNLAKKEMRILLIDKEEIGVKTSLNVRNFNHIINKFVSENTDFINSFPNIKNRINAINKAQNDELLKNISGNKNITIIKDEVQEINFDNLKIQDKEYFFKKVVFATGSSYDKPKYDDLNETMYFNLNQIQDMDQKYENVAIYGATVEGLMLAQSLSKIGSKVYIIDENISPLSSLDEEVESTLYKKFSNENITWLLDTKVLKHIPSSDNSFRITFLKNEEHKFIEVNKIIIANNKIPNTDIKSSEQIFLNSKKAFIIDKNFRLKNNIKFYAIGDCNGINMQPNQGTYQAMTLAKNILYEQNDKKIDFYNNTFILDASPQILFHGMTKDEIISKGINFNEFVFDFSKEFSSHLFGHHSKIKVYTNQKHEILGVFLLGDQISDLFPMLILARKLKIKFHQISTINFPFYTKSEGLKDAAMEYESTFVGFSKKLQKIMNKRKSS